MPFAQGAASWGIIPVFIYPHIAILLFAFGRSSAGIAAYSLQIKLTDPHYHSWRSLHLRGMYKEQYRYHPSCSSWQRVIWDCLFPFLTYTLFLIFKTFIRSCKSLAASKAILRATSCSSKGFEKSMRSIYRRIANDLDASLLMSLLIAMKWPKRWNIFVVFIE